jgi:biotin transporter BioY
MRILNNLQTQSNQMRWYKIAFALLWTIGLGQITWQTPLLSIIPWYWGACVFSAHLLGTIPTLVAYLTSVLIQLFGFQLLPVMKPGIESILGIDGGQLWGIAAMILVVGEISNWKEAYRPWWSFLIQTLGFTLIIGLSAFWLTAFSFPFHSIQDFVNKLISGCLLLIASQMFIIQLILRFLKGRKGYYSTKL